MTPPVNTASLNKPFTGWDELRSTGPAWKIERSPTTDDRYVPFFPDQNGKVYELLLANFPIMLHCMDGGGRITSTNKRWTDMLGYSFKEIEGKPFVELLSAESRSHLVQNVFPNYLQSGICQDILLELQRKDGSTLKAVLSMNAYRGDKGRIERSVCLLQDIPDDVRTVSAPVSSDAMVAAQAFAKATQGMALISPAGVIITANDAFWDFTGTAEEARAGLAIDQLLHPEDRAEFLSALTAVTSLPSASPKRDFRFGSTAENSKDSAIRLSPVKGTGEEVTHIVVEIADSSERKGAERRLLQAQKMEAIGQLTGGLAHDFNNLLTVVIGNLELLEGRLIADERASRRLAEAIDAARRGSALTRQMLAVARKQELEPCEVKINALVSSMEPLISRTIGEMIEIRVDVMPGEPKAVIDPSQLESAILNLSINARDAMPKGGRLTIETQPVYLDEAYAARHSDVTPGHYVMVAVSDTGSGMSPELLEKVFQPFFTTKDAGKGTGLGLAMVYGFIKQSGGHINVYSEVGHGTAIKMYLPRKLAPGEVVEDVMSSSTEIDAAPTQSSEPKIRILVVEDQEAVRAVACGFLQDFGYDVIEAEDGLSALARLQEDPSIRLMFSDVVMPGGLNGFDLAQAARGIRPDLKIVHTSGYPKGAMVHQEEPRFREGFIIMKPYRREDLQKIIRDALELQR